MISRSHRQPAFHVFEAKNHPACPRRYAELCVGYAESHDQALVGDKTIAFWLMVRGRRREE